MSKYIIYIVEKNTIIEFNNFNDAKEYYDNYTKYEVDIRHFKKYNYDLVYKGYENIFIIDWVKIDKNLKFIPIKPIQLFLRNNNIKEILS